MLNFDKKTFKNMKIKIFSILGKIAADCKL